MKFDGNVGVQVGSGASHQRCARSAHRINSDIWQNSGAIPFLALHTCPIHAAFICMFLSRVYHIKGLVHKQRDCQIIEQHLKPIFPMFSSEGHVPEDFCNFLKATVWQGFPLYAATGLVCGGENLGRIWASSLHFHPSHNYFCICNKVQHHKCLWGEFVPKRGTIIPILSVEVQTPINIWASEVVRPTQQGLS